jgi:hypothetical protein
LFTVLACKHNRDEQLEQMLRVYLSFIHYMQTGNGEFKNFMSYTRAAEEERGSEDSFGRTMMALGYLVNHGPSLLLVKTGADIFMNAYPHIDQLGSIRGIANSLVGVCKFIQYNYPDDRKKQLVIRLADKMLRMYELNRTDDWQWFEPILCYDNAILPLALLHAYEISGNTAYLDVAMESLQFQESYVFNKGVLIPNGNQGWMVKDGVPADFDQQGIDAMAMVLCYQQALVVTGNIKYQRRMYRSYLWFLGSNDLGISLYDESTGGSADGLHSEGINLNQGAESTLAYWISHMIVAAELKE